MRPHAVRGPAAAGAGAALFWALLCLRWFDVGVSRRPPWLEVVPPVLPGVAALVLLLAWLRARWATFAAPPLAAARGGLWLVVLLAIAFRLPLAWQGAAGAVTPDGALSGIVALHVRDGIERLVFVPNVPYSGSLKSHVTALLALAIDPARAFALTSVLFYAAFVAAVYRLALLVRDPATALAAGLYLAFAPPYLTHYSVSNDGNYVEVLALGTWALWLAARWCREEDLSERARLALGAGLLLGLGFWCHILAVIHLAAVGLVLVSWGGARALRSGLALGGGLALGYLPGLLWNAANGWASLAYLVPGGPIVRHAAEERIAPGAHAVAIVTEQLRFLFGYDFGYTPFVDGLFAKLAALAVGVALLATVVAVGRAWRGPNPARRVLLLFVVVNVLFVVLALPHITGNPRYLLFLMAALPVFLAEALDRGWKRGLMGALIAFGALGSIAAFPGAVRDDDKWRGFVSRLEREGVRWCYTDFHLATQVNFLSEERIVCTAKLGPTTGEYFFSYRDQVERAPEAALIPVNRTAADRLEKRLAELGVTFERRELLKPVLLRLSRKVDPEELFPGREFPLR